MVIPLRPSKNDGLKRLRRSPDAGDVPSAAKRPRVVDDPPRYQTDQAPSGARSPWAGLSPKTFFPVETAMDPRRPSDPRRRQSEPSQDPRRQPLDSNQNVRTHSPAEASKDPRPPRPTKSSIPYAPMPTVQPGNASPPTTPFAVSPSSAGKTSFFEPGILLRQKVLEHQIADTQAKVCVLSVDQKSALEKYEETQDRLNYRMTTLLQTQADVERSKLEELTAELKMERDKLHQLIDDKQELQGQLMDDAFNRIWQQLPQPSNTKPIGAADPEFSEVLQTIDSKLDARMTGCKASLRIEMSSDIDKKMAGERLKSDLKDKLSQVVKEELDAQMTGYMHNFIAEMTTVVDKKLADERLSLHADMTSVMHKRLSDERETTNKQLQKQLLSLEYLQEESWELQKAGLSGGAVKRWSRSLPEHDNRIKTLEEAKASRRSPSPDLQNRLQKHDDRIKALEGDVDKSLRSEISRLDAKTKFLADSLQKLQEAGSANDLRSDLEQLRSRTKALEEGHAKPGEAYATNDLRSEFEILKSKSQGLEEGIKKLTTSGNGLQIQLEQLNAKSEALGDSIQKLEQAHSSHVSKSQYEALAADFKKLKEEATLNNSSQSDIETHKADFRDLKKATSDLNVCADVQTLKSQFQLLSDSIVKLQRLEENVEAAQEDVRYLQQVAHKFSNDIEWTRRCIDHRSPDFFRMPLYGAICTLFKPNGQGDKGRFDDVHASPPAIMMVDERIDDLEERLKRQEAISAGQDELLKELEDKFEENKNDIFGLDDRLKELGDKFEENENDISALDDRLKELGDKFEENENDISGLDDRLKELGDKFEKNESDREGDLWDEHNKLENQIAALNEKSHLLPGQFEELSRKFGQLSQVSEALPARIQQLDQKFEQLDGEVKQCQVQASSISENAVSVAKTQLSQDTVREIVSAEMRTFEEHVKVLEARAKQDGRYLKKKVVGLCERLQQDVKDLQSLDIIKTGQRDINSLSRFVRLHDDQILAINVKISALENSTTKLFPHIVERVKQHETMISGTENEICLLQMYVASMAKRFSPVHYVPPDWETRCASMEQVPSSGTPRMLPARPPSAVQGQYR